MIKWPFVWRKDYEYALRENQILWDRIHFLINRPKWDPKTKRWRDKGKFSKKAKAL